jgi:hypothetical protein
MKQIYLIILALIISNFITAQQKFSYDPIKLQKQSKDKRYLISKDKNSSKINMDTWVASNLLSQMWTDNDWMNMAYTEFSYDSNGNLITDLNKGWSDNAWVNNSRTTYTYEGNLGMEAVTENWGNETWVPYIKTQWTYNENGRVTKMFDQLWENNEWVNTSQNTYTYDGNNCTELLMQDWVNGAWETSHKTTYEYDGEGNNISSISETWLMGFLITSKEINTFEQGLRKTVLSQNLVGTDWMDASKATYSYNENRQEIQFVSEQWTGTEWKYTMQGIYTYDANGNNTEALTQNWEDNAWVNFMKLTYNYQQTTDVEENNISVKEFRLFNNYPNPFNPSTVISYQLPVSSYITLKIFDIIGNELATLVNEEKPAGSYQVEFNAANLPSGLYFYKLQAGNYSETKKMLMIK